MSNALKIASAMGAAAGGGGGSDPNFSNVSLLLHGDGTNGAQNNTFVDGSSNNFTITRNGNTTQGAFSPFTGTGGSGYFDGTGDYLNLTLGAATGSSFTVEAWVYIAAYPAAGQTYGIASTTNQATTPEGWRIRIDTSGVAQFGETWGVNNFNSDSVIPLNQWVHIAGVRSGSGAGNTTMYVNGVKQTKTGTFNKTYTSTSMVVGRTYTGVGTEYMLGYVSNLRLSSTARYSATFTTSTTPFTSDGSTTLLLNFTNAGITDSARKADLETVGNAQVSTSVVKYGTGSIYFDGTGDYLTTPSNAAFAFGTGDFTVEAWVYITATNSGSLRVFTTSGVNSNFAFEIDSSRQLSHWNGTTNFVLGGTVPLNAWTHVSWVRSGTTVTGYINGSSIGTATSSANMVNNLVVSVAATANYTSGHTAYIDDLRITKGVARYTANFTPPTAAFPDA